jgi:hypothetical protein
MDLDKYSSGYYIEIMTYFSPVLEHTAAPMGVTTTPNEKIIKDLY